MRLKQEKSQVFQHALPFLEYASEYIQLYPVLTNMQRGALYILEKEASSLPLNQVPDASILYLRVFLLVYCKIQELTLIKEFCFRIATPTQTFRMRFKKWSVTPKVLILTTTVHHRKSLVYSYFLLIFITF